MVSLAFFFIIIHFSRSLRPAIISIFQFRLSCVLPLFGLDSRFSVPYFSSLLNLVISGLPIVCVFVVTIVPFAVANFNNRIDINTSSQVSGLFQQSVHSIQKKKTDFREHLSIVSRRCLPKSPWLFTISAFSRYMSI